MNIKFKQDENLVNKELTFIRLATKEDFARRKNCIAIENRAKIAFNEFSANLELEIKLVDVLCSLKKNKMIFHFYSTHRIDFRELVRELSMRFKIKIELRQVSVREFAKKLSGIGSCGRKICCSTMANNFNHISIKMAKDQNLSLSPGRIFGQCGKLMCCLQFEKQSYDFFKKSMLNVGDLVNSSEGKGVVVSSNLISGEFKVKMEKDSVIKIFKRKCLRKIEQN